MTATQKQCLLAYFGFIILVNGVFGSISLELVEPIFFQADPPAVIVLVEVPDGITVLLRQSIYVCVHTISFLPVAR